MAGSGQPAPKKNTFCNGEPKKLLYWQNLDCLEVVQSLQAHAVGMLGIAVIDKHMIFTKRCTVGDMNLEGEIKIQADNLGKKSRCGIQNS